MCFYVSPNGNDRWTGRLPARDALNSDGPFGSLARARDAVRETRAGRTSGSLIESPITVFLLEGTHRLAEALVLDARDSGTLESPVTYAAFPGTKPILSGSVELKDWEPYKGEILRCTLPELKGKKTRQLFLDGERQTRARWPHPDPRDPLYGGWAFVETPLDDGFVYDAPCFDEAPSPQPHLWSRPDQAEVLIFPWYCWVSDAVPIRSVDHRTRTIRLASKPHYPWMELLRGNRFIVENVLEEIRGPGQWCIDNTAGTVYFWPPAGALPGTITVPVTDRLIDIHGTDREPARCITVTGLTLAETQSPFPEQLNLENFHSPTVRGEGIRIENAEHCRIEDNVFVSLGGDGIHLRNRVSHTTIAGNTIHHVGCSGVSIASDAPGNVATWVDKGALDEVSRLYPRCAHNIVTRNHVHHNGVFKKNCAGIQVCGINSIETVLSHNHIHHTSDKGIAIQDGFGRLVVEYNLMHDIALEICDTGAIMTNRWFVLEHDEELCHGNVFRFNVIRDVIGCGAYGTPKEEKPTGDIKAGGRIWAPYYTWGIYFDNSATGTLVYGNLVVRAVLGGVSIPVGDPKDNVIANNILVDCLIHQADLRIGGESASGNRFVRNILYSTSPDIATLGIGPRTAGSFSECDHNLYYCGGRPDPVVKSIGKASETSEAVFDEWRRHGFDLHSIVGDPLFVDPDRGDYRLQPESPAFSLGFVPLPRP